MDQILSAAELVEDLRYLDDIQLVDNDLVGCVANVNDIPDRPRQVRVKRG